MTRSRLVAAAAVVMGVALVLAVADPAWAAATGNDVGENLSRLLRHYASELYVGVLAIVSVTFLINRRYGELTVFVLAAMVVAWLVFSPDNVAHAARSIGNQIF